MKDIEIFQNIGVPLQTLQLWKKSDNYRKLLYELLKNMPKDYIEEIKKRVDQDRKLVNYII
jgi:formate dehydrogenase maturation protein FdhE